MQMIALSKYICLTQWVETDIKIFLLVPCKGNIDAIDFFNLSRKTKKIIEITNQITT